ncbi:MAG TPA: hypothetical protein VM695_09985 [Phycisphaerae bacterium]|nr:hypothetical protein [Phycisphaerae bacterium]
MLQHRSAAGTLDFAGSSPKDQDHPDPLILAVRALLRSTPREEIAAALDRAHRGDWPNQPRRPAR